MPDLSGAAGEQRELIAGLRAVIEAKDAELAALREGFAAVRADLEAERELRRRLELRVAELERRLRMDSSDSGTPPSKEPIGARERRKARQRERQSPERERRRTASRAGSPGIPVKGRPGIRTRTSGQRPARPRSAASAGPAWTAPGTRDRRGRRSGTSRSSGMSPSTCCRGCGVRAADGDHRGTAAGRACRGSAYGPLLNAAAVLLTAYGNVPPERAAKLIGMLLRMPVRPGSLIRPAPGWTEAASAGFDEAMRAALEDEPALAADGTPVNVLTPALPGHGEPVPGAAQVMVIRTPDERLVWLQALASRRAEGITALLAFFPGFLIVDGYSAYQQYPASSPGSRSAASTSSAAAAPSRNSAPAACSPGPAT